MVVKQGANEAGLATARMSLITGKLHTEMAFILLYAIPSKSGR